MIRKFYKMTWRKVEENIFYVIMVISTLIVIGLLFSILLVILFKGLPALSLNMLIKTPRGGYYLGKEGGILNAILGSLFLGLGATFLAFLMSLPVAFYLNFYLPIRSGFAQLIRFVLDVLWGIPSIVYGAFGFTVMIYFGLRASLLAGTITVALFILPMMARGMDEVFKMVPFELMETSYALGSTRFETALKVVLRQCLPGILTAILVSFGRGISDAASVLFTASFTDSLPLSLMKPAATLPLAIFFQLATPFPEVQQRGYASAFVLTVIVLLISILTRVFSSKFTRHVVK